MKRTLMVLFLMTALASGASKGSFLGKIVNGPEAGGSKKWIYVQGANGAVRKVNVMGAKVHYTEQVPRAQRESRPSQALREGARVRVTASEDESGEWKASEVEIVAVAR